MNPQIQTALISVSDKSELLPLAKRLQKLNIQIIATGGTAKVLEKAKLKIIPVNDLTGFPELLDGRVKTLHPAIFAGILARRKNKKDLAELKQQQLKPIDLVIVNLYPFQKTIEKKVDLQEALENIDIGGVSLLRAAAKNFQDVIVISDPKDYAEILDELEQKGDLTEEKRRDLAVKSFIHTTDYDAAIARYLSKDDFFFWHGKKISDLRYGENYEQKAALFTPTNIEKNKIFKAPKWLQGKLPSYNNLSDSDAAINLVAEFTRPTVAIIKHANPCGVASADTIFEAFNRAFSADSRAAFGGIVTLNRACDEKTAVAMKKIFLEVIIAPNFSAGALKIFAEKKHLRLLKIDPLLTALERKFEIKTINTGLLFQDADRSTINAKKFKIVSTKNPTEAQINDLIFAWKIAKHVKSNAIVLAKNEVTTGIGPGQTARIEAVELSIKKAGAKTQGSVMASDAFFPFPDSVETAAQAGIVAIVHPGGSIRDQESIDAANKANIILVTTGIRTFKH